MDALEKRILDLLRVPEIGDKIKLTKTADEAAKLLIQLGGAKASGLDVASVTQALDKSEQKGLSELTDDDLTAVSGGMMGGGKGGPNTGGHTQCCYHCYP